MFLQIVFLFTYIVSYVLHVMCVDIMIFLVALVEILF